MNPSGGNRAGSLLVVDNSLAGRCGLSVDFATRPVYGAGRQQTPKARQCFRTVTGTQAGLGLAMDSFGRSQVSVGANTQPRTGGRHHA